MNNLDETLKRTPENEAVSQSAAELADKFDNLSDKFDDLEKFLSVQFKPVQEGIEYTSAKYHRLEAKFFDVRSDVSNMRADIKELIQAIRKKEFV